MNTIERSLLPQIGEPLAGGFFAGLFQLSTETFALIIAPKADGQRNDIAWGEPGAKIGDRKVNDFRARAVRRLLVI